jgi:hypothetical protein
MAMSSLTKLDRMYQLLTAGDDNKLSRGEVDALAGFYKGLAPRSQATVKARMVEIYRDSTYSAGQKSFFRNALEDVGFTTEELEGIKGNGRRPSRSSPWTPSSSGSSAWGATGGTGTRWR